MDGCQDRFTGPNFPPLILPTAGNELRMRSIRRKEGLMHPAQKPFAIFSRNSFGHDHFDYCIGLLFSDLKYFWGSSCYLIILYRSIPIHIFIRIQIWIASIQYKMTWNRKTIFHVGQSYLLMHRIKKNHISFLEYLQKSDTWIRQKGNWNN